MLFVGLAFGMAICAVQAVRARSLLHAVLWLACTSALLSTFLYLLGAREVAVIELSVGAGLVTVLIVFALNLVGETYTGGYSPRYSAFSLGLVLVVVMLLGWFIFPMTPVRLPPVTLSNALQPVTDAQKSFSAIIWEQRGLDTLLQLLLIFSGALGILSLALEKATEKPQNMVVETAQSTPEYPPIIPVEVVPPEADHIPDSPLEEEETEDVFLPI